MSIRKLAVVIGVVLTLSLIVVSCGTSIAGVTDYKGGTNMIILPMGDFGPLPWEQEWFESSNKCSRKANKIRKDRQNVTVYCFPATNKKIKVVWTPAGAQQ
jgi:hypothetical protein